MDRFEQIKQTVSDLHNQDAKFLDDLTVELEQDTTKFLEKLAVMDTKVAAKFREYQTEHAFVNFKNNYMRKIAEALEEEGKELSNAMPKAFANFSLEQEVNNTVQTLERDMAKHHIMISKFLRDKDAHTLRIIKRGDESFANRIQIPMVTAAQKDQTFDVEDKILQKNKSRLIMVAGRKLKADARRAEILRNEIEQQRKIISKMDGNSDSETDSD
jgi:hypothetical protein